MMNNLKTALKSSAAKFGRDENGNFGMMAAIIGLVLIGGLACSIDMTNAMSAKMRLQDTTDAIALVAAKDKLQTQAEIQAAANAYFTLNYPNNTGDRIVINSITRVDDTVTIDATNTVDTYFANVFGYKTMNARVLSSATYAQRNVDIALVLDTTGSMQGTKLTSLKSAATNLVTTLDGAQNSKLNISVVPFAQYVNVGMSRRSAPWIEVPADYKENVTWNRAIPNTGVCTPYQGTCSNDSGTYSCQKWSCTGQEFEQVTSEVEYKWFGCVGSRQAPWHEEVAYNNKKIPGLLDRWKRCGTEILPLTNDMNAVKSTISSLTATGYTYIPSGLAWGWRTLDTNEPLTEATIDPNSETEKALILMTDGANTRSKNGLKHTVGNGNQANQLTKTMCEDIKGSEITVYTIAYELSDIATKNMLTRCATDNGKFFDASNAAQLEDAFQDIADSLNELRLTN